MMSPETIRQLEKEAAFNAWLAEVEPYNPGSANEVRRWKTCPAPNLGSLRPEGWRVVDAAFVDKTGWDNSGPAMSFDAFKTWAATWVENDPTVGFGLVQEGQFQVYIAAFTQDDAMQATDEAADWVEGQTFTEEDAEYCPSEDCGNQQLEGSDYCESCGAEMHPKEFLYRNGEKVKVLRRLFDNSSDPFDEVEAIVTEDVEDGESLICIKSDEYSCQGEIVVCPEDISKPDYNPEADPAQPRLI